MKTLILSLVAAATLAGALPAMAQSIPAREQMQPHRIEHGVRLAHRDHRPVRHIRRAVHRVDRDRRIG